MAKHRRIKYSQNNTYDNSVDPVTKGPFEFEEVVIVCPEKNSLISLRSLQANGYQCPFCLNQLDSNLGVVEAIKPSEATNKKPSPSPYPEPSQRRPAFPIWIGLAILSFLLISVGAVVITRAPPNVSPTQTLINLPQPDPNNANAEDPGNESTSLPTESPIVPVEADHWIVFAYGQDQVGGSGSTTGRDLYLLNWKTDEKRQLTTGHFGDNFPSFSSDGESVVFTRCSPDCQLYLLNVRTGSEQKILGNAVKAMAPKWCLTKPWIVFEDRRNGNRQISLSMIDLSDNKITPLTKGPADSRPVWSPDCSKVLFGRATADTNRDGVVTTNDRLDMYVLDVLNHTTDILLETPDADEFGYTWSPNNNSIAFTRVSEDTDHNGQITLNDQSDLFLYDLNMKQETNLTKGTYSAFSPTFSFDGNFIVFTSFEGSGSRIVVYSVFDSTFSVVSEIGPYYHASWQP